jgi:hypothetical protein
VVVVVVVLGMEVFVLGLCGKLWAFERLAAEVISHT